MTFHRNSKNTSALGRLDQLHLEKKTLILNSKCVFFILVARAEDHFQFYMFHS